MPLVRGPAPESLLEHNQGGREMKRITLAFVAALILGCAVAAFAEKMEIPESVTMSPKQFDGYTAKKGDVVFNHASHM